MGDMSIVYFDSLKVLIHFSCFATRLINKELQEKCTAENLHKNINSKLDLFPDRLHPNQKRQGILKGSF